MPNTCKQHYNGVRGVVLRIYVKYCRFSGVYSRNNLTKIKDGTYVVNRDEYEEVGTHWIAFYVNGGQVMW